ncbi:MAG: formate dehydrogenase accessory protein FdhE [Chloroflexi bacterium]|nr:formate dehydrogenase accessory protein FdhE [Chloroflexota bacterium]
MIEKETLAVLRVQRARHLDIADTIDLHIAILGASASLEISVPPPPHDANERLSLGQPLLRADELSIDWTAATKFLQNLCAIFAHNYPNLATDLEEIAREFATPTATEEIVREWWIDPERKSLTSVVLYNVMRPVLSAYARAWVACVGEWQHSTCPICGGVTDFAALAVSSGARRMLCSQCNFEWDSTRVGCPFCDADQLAYFATRSGAYRLYVCDRCKRYLKTIDLRELARDANLPAERVLTIALDRAAHQAGYR